MQTDICDAEPHKIKSSFTASWKMVVSLIDVTLNREQAIIFPAAKLTDPVRDGRDLRPSQNSGAGARRTTSTYNANKTSQRNTDHMRRIICQHPIPLIFFFFFFFFFISSLVNEYIAVSMLDARRCAASTSSPETIVDCQLWRSFSRLYDRVISYELLELGRAFIFLFQEK